MLWSRFSAPQCRCLWVILFAVSAMGLAHSSVARIQLSALHSLPSSIFTRRLQSEPPDCFLVHLHPSQRSSHCRGNSLVCLCFNLFCKLCFRQFLRFWPDSQVHHADNTDKRTRNCGIPACARAQYLIGSYIVAVMALRRNFSDVCILCPFHKTHGVWNGRGASFSMWRSGLMLYGGDNGTRPDFAVHDSENSTTYRRHNRRAT